MVALQEQFQFVDYNDKLYKKIRRAVIDYLFELAVIDNLFERLIFKIPNKIRLKILLYNINPCYQTQLGLTKIKN